MKPNEGMPIDYEALKQTVAEKRKQIEDAGLARWDYPAEALWKMPDWTCSCCGWLNLAVRSHCRNFVCTEGRRPF